jgi:diacylglycerol kinase family enzyme
VTPSHGQGLRPAVAVLLNRASGAPRETGIRAQIQELFFRFGMEISIDELDADGGITVAARKALDAHPDAIVAGGGDGTLNAVASVLAGSTTPLGVLPLGTRNHFAKDLHIPLDLDKAVQVIADRHVKRIDVGRIGDRVFLNNSSIGLYPSIVEARERLRQHGHAKWIAFVLATIEVLRREEEVAIRVESNGRAIVARTPFLFVGNNEYLVEGINLGARTRLDSGRLSAYFAPPVRTRDVPKLFAQALLGHARREHALEVLIAEEFWVDTPSHRQIQVACDGELLTSAPPLHFRAWPGGLNVIVPAE